MEEYSLASQDSLLSFPCSSDLSLCGSRKQERLSSNNCMPSFSADPSLLHFCLCVDTGRNTVYKVILLDTGFLDREFFLYYALTWSQSVRSLCFENQLHIFVVRNSPIDFITEREIFQGTTFVLTQVKNTVLSNEEGILSSRFTKRPCTSYEDGASPHFTAAISSCLCWGMFTFTGFSERLIFYFS